MAHFWSTVLTESQKIVQNYYRSLKSAAVCLPHKPTVLCFGVLNNLTDTRYDLQFIFSLLSPNLH